MMNEWRPSTSTKMRIISGMASDGCVSLSCRATLSGKASKLVRIASREPNLDDLKRRMMSWTRPRRRKLKKNEKEIQPPSHQNTKTWVRLGNKVKTKWLGFEWAPGEWRPPWSIPVSDAALCPRRSCRWGRGPWRCSRPCCGRARPGCSRRRWLSSTTCRTERLNTLLVRHWTRK